MNDVLLYIGAVSITDVLLQTNTPDIIVSGSGSMFFVL
jgi:hypothetical protein